VHNLIKDPVNGKHSKWQAHIKIDNISIHLGLFETIEKAKAARISKANSAFGVYVNACEN